MNAVFVRDCRMPFVLAHFATHLTERLSSKSERSKDLKPEAYVLLIESKAINIGSAFHKMG